MVDRYSVFAKKKDVGIFVRHEDYAKQTALIRELVEALESARADVESYAVYCEIIEALRKAQEFY